MILACPACGTKYVVPDDALGTEGRTVRCAKCKHSWFQDGPDIVVPPANRSADEPFAPPAAEPPRRVRRAAATAPNNAPLAAGSTPPTEEGRTPEVSGNTVEQPAPKPEPAAEPPPPAQRAADGHPVLPDAAVTPPPFYRASDKSATRTPPAAQTPTDEAFPSFDYQPPFRPRRNHLRLFTVAAASFAVLAVLAIVALRFWGLPSWLPTGQPVFAGPVAGLSMTFPPPRVQTRTLPSGGKFLSIGGTVVNTGRETRDVPPILVMLVDESDRVVFSQEIAPPKPQLAPGERADVNEAIADVPPEAVDALFGWASR